MEPEQYGEGGEACSCPAAVETEGVGMILGLALHIYASHSSE